MGKKIDVEDGFNQWVHKKYPTAAFQQRHRLIGSAEVDGFNLKDMEAAYKAGVKLKGGN